MRILCLVPAFLFWLTGALPLQAQRELPLPLRQEDAALPVATDAAFLALKEACNRALERKDDTAAARCLQQMGQACYHLGHYPQALNYHLQAGQLLRLHGPSAQMAANLNDMGTLYYYNRQPALARRQYTEALGIYSALRNREGMALTLGKIGHLYEKQQQYDSAFHYQRRALEQYLQLDNRQGMAKIYENIGSIYEDQQQYDSAYRYFQQALLLNSGAAGEMARIEVLNNLGDVLRKTGRYQEALQQTRAALALAMHTGEQYQLCSAYRDIARTYNLTGRHDSAYYYLELSRRHLLDIYSDQSSRQVALLQTMYDIERKDHEIERLKHMRNTTRIITLAIITVGLLLLALGMLIISRQRLKIRNARILNEQERQMHLARQQLMQTALENRKLQEENLKQELEVRSKELSAHTLHLIQKNQLLENLHSRLDEMVKDERRDQKKQLKQLQLQIGQHFNHDRHWEEFHSIFEQVHQSFFDNLKTYCETLTPNDLRLVALLKMNLGSADIATLLGISQDSLRVLRYRLRKKLGLAQGESLTVFIQSL